MRGTLATVGSMPGGTTCSFASRGSADFGGPVDRAYANSLRATKKNIQIRKKKRAIMLLPQPGFLVLESEAGLPGARRLLAPATPDVHHPFILRNRKPREREEGGD